MKPHRRLPIAVAATFALGLTACGGGSGFDDPGSDPTGANGAQSPSGSLEVLIASSGDAETKAVEDAVKAWGDDAGVEATVNVAADLPQQLSQGFAAGSPPDAFYVSTDFFAGYASNGSIVAYGDKLANADDFYPTLADSFTFEDQLFCAPKDFSTLALIINEKSWADAGLSDADIPQTWDDLSAVAGKLTTDDQVGLTFGPEWQRIGVFMAQAGGGLVDDSGAAIVDSAENLAALEYVQQLLASGSAAYPSDIGAGWGGEAFGTEAAAMAIEGNWLIGAMTNDFPDVEYKVVELPAGAGGKGTLQFTNCWGIAADSSNQESAQDLIEFLTSTDQQMEFAKAFGVMPSVESAADAWSSQFPEQEPFLAGAEYAQGVPPIEGISDVISDFNSQLEGLKSGDAQAILTSVQSSLEAIN